MSLAPSRALKAVAFGETKKLKLLTKPRRGWLTPLFAQNCVFTWCFPCLRYVPSSVQDNVGSKHQPEGHRDLGSSSRGRLGEQGPFC